IVLGGRTGWMRLCHICGLALLGILFKAFWVDCPKWVSSIFYIGMGWACILTLPELLSSMTDAQFAWLLAGGILYTVGGIIYALKLGSFNEKHKSFGSHEIFHLFVMGGSACHFVLMYLLV
ncbi:MAG: hemolysin III family protein, partial [Firmicutes bacterium]|nr:hemolysin III family protein [Bacillota bacterium]